MLVAPFLLTHRVTALVRGSRQEKRSGAGATRASAAEPSNTVTEQHCGGRGPMHPVICAITSAYR